MVVLFRAVSRKFPRFQKQKQEETDGGPAFERRPTEMDATGVCDATWGARKLITAMGIDSSLSYPEFSIPNACRREENGD